MYVTPEHRGAGLSRWMLGALEEEARGFGYRRIRLETGVHQHEALGLYRSAGYVEVPAYNENPKADLWFERTLARTPEASAGPS